MKNKIVYLILIAMIISMCTGIMMGLCIGMNMQKEIINTGDTYKYYNQQDDSDELKAWNI